MICETKEDLICKNCIFSGFSRVATDDYRECKRTTKLMDALAIFPDDEFCGEGQWRVEEKVQDNTRINVCTLDVAIEILENDGVSPWA